MACSTHTYSVFIAPEYATKDKEWFKLASLIKSTEGVIPETVNVCKDVISYLDEDGNRLNTIYNLSRFIHMNPFLKGKRKSQLTITNKEAFYYVFRGHFTDQLFIAGRKSQVSEETRKLVDLILHHDIPVWNDNIPEGSIVVYIDGE